jgi:hypothetical protein
VNFRPADVKRWESALRDEAAAFAAGHGKRVTAAADRLRAALVAPNPAARAVAVLNALTVLRRRSRANSATPIANRVRDEIEAAAAQPIDENI